MNDEEKKNCPHKVQYRFNPIKPMWEIKYGDSEWEDFVVGFANETEVKQMIEMVIK